MTERFNTKEGAITIHHKEKAEPDKYKRKNAASVKKRFRPLLRKLEAYRLRNKLPLQAFSELLGFSHQTYGQWIRDQRIPWATTFRKLKVKMKNLLDMERALDGGPGITSGPRMGRPLRGGGRTPEQHAETEAAVRPMIREIEAIRETLHMSKEEVAGLIGCAARSWRFWIDGATPLGGRIAPLRRTLGVLRDKCSARTLELIREGLKPKDPELKAVGTEQVPNQPPHKVEIDCTNEDRDRMPKPPMCIPNQALLDTIERISDNPPLQEQRVRYIQMICKDCKADIKIGNKIKDANVCPLCGSGNIRVAVERVVTQVDWVDREEEE